MQLQHLGLLSKIAVIITYCYLHIQRIANSGFMQICIYMQMLELAPLEAYLFVIFLEGLIGGGLFEMGLVKLSGSCHITNSFSKLLSTLYKQSSLNVSNTLLQFLCHVF